MSNTSVPIALKFVTLFICKRKFYENIISWEKVGATIVYIIRLEAYFINIPS